MGCGNDKNKKFLEDNANDNLYEKYDELNPYNYNISFYNLIWKKKPDICYFQKISEETVERSKMNNLTIILDKITIEHTDKIKYLIEQSQILFYIFCTNGVIITRNEIKINYYISNYLDSIINLSFVDISFIILQEKEYFSLYELKRQSKYFFHLNMREIDFTKRNQLTNEGKMEQLSDLEDIEEVEKEEKKEEIHKDIEIRINMNHFNGEYMKNENSNFLGIFDAKKQSISIRNVLMDVNSILNKEQNNKVLKEIKGYNDKDKSKNRNIVQREKSNKILNTNKSSNVLKLFSDNSSNNLNLEENNNLIRNSNKFKINKSKEKNSKDKYQKDSKSKEKNSKNDKLLFQNKKELNKKLNIKIYQIPKQGSTTINDSSRIKEEKTNNTLLNEKTIINIVPNNVNVENQEKKEVPTSSFEIKDKCLIITTDKLTKEINSKILNILFTYENKNKNNVINSNNKDKEENDKKFSPVIDSSFDHINFSLEEKRKKSRRRSGQVYHSIRILENRISINVVGNNEKVSDNDYIIIFNKNKVPFDKKISSHRINKIYFKDCNFEPECSYYLKELISMIIKYDDLKKIYFYHNDFRRWKFLSQLFKENFKLRWISFKNSEINDSIFEKIISSLFLKRVRYLNFSNNFISNKGMYCLNTFLIKNQTLSILNLSHNHDITKEGIKLILNSLKFHPHIYKLDLSYMEITGSGEFISALLNDNKSLNILLLKKDKFNTKDIEFISRQLSKRESRLEHLDLSENIEIGDDGLKEIGRLIYNNKSLKSIGLDGMNLSIYNYLPLFNGIFKNKTIENYSMGKNRGLPLKGILNFFQKNPQVKVINIIPWDIDKPCQNEDEEENKFTEEEIFLLEKFHLKAPHVTLIGINFIDN